VGRKLYIDADVLVYESAFASQKTRYILEGMTFEDADQCKAYCELNNLNYRQLRKDGEITSEVELLPQGVARNIFKMKLDGICKACDSDNYKLILSGDGNYRDELAKTRKYKDRDQPKPHHYLFVRSLVIEHGAEVTVGIEADDSIGIDMAHDAEGVICTIDKDLNMLPGRHYDWNKQIKYKVPEPEAQRWFLTQLLTGDGVDNVPGIPGMGEKKAAAILDPLRGNVAGMWKAVLAEYNKGPFKFKDGQQTPHPIKYLNEQGVLLWIQRKKGELWTADYYTKRYT
jgi:hypothetical protein